MNTQSDALPKSSLESQAIAPAIISPARRMYWSVRRELWENRSIYLAPMAVAAVALVAFLISVIVLPQHRLSRVVALAPAKQRAAIELPYDIAASLIMATAVIVGALYCLDALHGERRDRSILFWKSLPVSDLTTVLSKLSIPVIVLPLLSFVITVATQLIMLLLSSAILLGSGLSAAPIWTHASPFPLSLMMLYHLVTVHGLWYLPFYGWLLLISAWAPRAPFLWAVLPPFAICVVEKIGFNTSYFLSLLKYRAMGPEASTAPGSSLMDVLSALTPAQFFSTPGLWMGLALGVAFIAAAVRLRRHQGPI